MKAHQSKKETDEKGTSAPAGQPEPETQGIQAEEENATTENGRAKAEQAKPDAGPDMRDTEIAAMVAEAEERGYRRGLEEGAASAQDRTAKDAADGADEVTTMTSTPTFLGHIRPGFWD